jgi:hypothetical protein
MADKPIDMEDRPNRYQRVVMRPSMIIALGAVGIQNASPVMQTRR